MNEFDIIEKYFAPLTMGQGALDNDAALIDVPAGQQLVMTTDTLNEGIHFFAGADPADIAHKALRVNLSDLAAMGATPLCYQLSLAFPDHPPKPWLEGFTGALMADQIEFGLYCSGGDTTSIKGPLSISVTALGLVPNGAAITRSGAQDGDAVVLSGPVGDAYLGFKNPDDAYFKERYYRPQPRLDLAEAMRQYAHAAIDISDGLIADLGHVCKASGVRADIQISDDFFPREARKVIERGEVTAAALLGGGDDYQLLLAVAADRLNDFMAAAPGCVQIGTFADGEPGVVVLDEDGVPVEIKHTGWSHF